MLIIIIKVLCLLNILKVLYRLSGFFHLFIYLKEYLKEIILKNWAGILLLIVCFIIIYSKIVLINTMIEQQQKILKELSEIKTFISDIYHTCDNNNMCDSYDTCDNYDSI